MTSFTSASLGEIHAPLNIFKEILAHFNKREKCKAAILSFFESRLFYQEWTRVTFEWLASTLGYHRDTISKHMNDLILLGLIERGDKAEWFPKDTAYNYKVNTDELSGYLESKSSTAQVLERCGKFSIDMPKNQHINAESSATYKNNTKDFKSISQERERETATQSFQDPQDTKTSLDNEQADKTQDSNSNNLPSVSSPVPKKRIKTENESREEKYVWEIEVDAPYPVFLNWWADTHYKPQGGRFETGARDFAYSEFYKNPKKTEVVMYADFLEYIKTTTESCNQVQNSGQTAVLPSCFIAKPEPTEQNTQTLMNNVKTLVERGAAVVLPTKSATPTSQTLPFAESQGAAVVKSLPALEQIDVDAELRKQRHLCGQPEEDIKLLNEWLISGDSRLRVEAQKQAVGKKYGFERGESGDIVRIFMPSSLPSLKSGTSNVFSVDWGNAVADSCQKLDDYWE